MRVLVTGGGGFLGRHIILKLLHDGHHVWAMSRSLQADLAEPGVECIQGDITDPGLVAQAVANKDAVFHVAALAGIWGPYETYYTINVTGTEILLDACLKAGVPRFIYTSTPSVVYGTDPIEGGDESLPYPETYLTPYAETKALAEQKVLAANNGAIRTVSLRPHLIFGPGDRHLIPRLIARAEAGRLFQVGAGNNQVSVSYVENVADAHVSAFERLEPGSPVCGQAYFINEPDPVNLWDFIRDLLRGLDCPTVHGRFSEGFAYTMGRVFESVYGYFGWESEPPMTRFLAKQLATSHWFKIDKALRELEWEPLVSLEEGKERLFTHTPN